MLSTYWDIDNRRMESLQRKTCSFYNHLTCQVSCRSIDNSRMDSLKMQPKWGHSHFAIPQYLQER